MKNEKNLSLGEKIGLGATVLSIIATGCAPKDSSANSVSEALKPDTCPATTAPRIVESGDTLFQLCRNAAVEEAGRESTDGETVNCAQSSSILRDGELLYAGEFNADEIGEGDIVCVSVVVEP